MSHFGTSPLFQNIRAGQFKEPFSLEELTAISHTPTMEPSLSNVFSPSRNTGAMAFGYLRNGRITWAAGGFRGLENLHSNVGREDLALTGRLTGEQSEARNRGWRPWNEHDEDGLVFSRPFVSEQGALLGNLYLKVTGVESGYEHWNEYEGPSVVSGTLTFGSLIFLWFLLPTWVYLDATARNMPSPVRWAALTLVGLVFGLAAYLIVRPEESAGRVCPGCSRDVGSARFCPHCGSPVSSEFCQGCGYPVRPDWSFCPNCQAPNRIEEPSESVGPTTPGTLPPEAEV